MTRRQDRKNRITKQREKQILDAALLVFSRQGFDKATVPDIARQAGIAVGTIYNYYPSKRELFVAVIKSLVITPPLLELIDRLPKGDITVTFRHIMQNRFELIDSNLVSHIPNLIAEVQRDPELKAIWTKQFIQPFLSNMEEVYGKSMASGKFRYIEPAIAVRCVGGMILGFLMLKIMEGDASPLNRFSEEEIVPSMIDLILHGLLNENIDEKD